MQHVTPVGLRDNLAARGFFHDDVRRRHFCPDGVLEFPICHGDPFLFVDSAFDHVGACAFGRRPVDEDENLRIASFTICCAVPAST